VHTFKHFVYLSFCLSSNSPIVNPQAQDLISRMLAKDASERITVLEMKVIYTL